MEPLVESRLTAEAVGAFAPTTLTLEPAAKTRSTSVLTGVEGSSCRLDPGWMEMDLAAAVIETVTSVMPGDVPPSAKNPT